MRNMTAGRIEKLLFWRSSEASEEQKEMVEGRVVRALPCSMSELRCLSRPTEAGR